MKYYKIATLKVGQTIILTSAGAGNTRRMISYYAKKNNWKVKTHLTKERLFVERLK